jgi:hypothetical protein
MATILDPATIVCTTDDDDRPSVAFVSHPLTDDTPPEGVIQNWWPYCGPCVERFTDSDFRVVYLHDPAADPRPDAAADRDRGHPHDH